MLLVEKYIYNMQNNILFYYILSFGYLQKLGTTEKQVYYRDSVHWLVIWFAYLVMIMLSQHTTDYMNNKVSDISVPAFLLTEQFINHRTKFLIYQYFIYADIPHRQLQIAGKCFLQSSFIEILKRSTKALQIKTKMNIGCAAVSSEIG